MVSSTSNNVQRDALISAAILFNVRAPSFPFEMCESVPVKEAVQNHNSEWKRET